MLRFYDYGYIAFTCMFRFCNLDYFGLLNNIQINFNVMSNIFIITRFILNKILESHSYPLII